MMAVTIQLSSEELQRIVCRVIRKDRAMVGQMIKGNHTHPDDLKDQIANAAAMDRLLEYYGNLD